MNFTLKSVATLTLGLMVAGLNAGFSDYIPFKKASLENRRTRLINAANMQTISAQELLAARQDLSNDEMTDSLHAQYKSAVQKLNKEANEKQDKTKVKNDKWTAEHEIKNFVPAPSRFGTKSKVAAGVVGTGLVIYGGYKAYQNRAQLAELAKRGYNSLTKQNVKAVANSALGYAKTAGNFVVANSKAGFNYVNSYSKKVKLGVPALAGTGYGIFKAYKNREALKDIGSYVWANPKEAAKAPFVYGWNKVSNGTAWVAKKVTPNWIAKKLVPTPL